MVLANGYETKTTFIQDFQIAEVFGEEAVKDTFKRAFNEWKDNIEYVTELAIVTNLLCWKHHGHNEKLSELYGEFYYTVYDYVYEDGHFTDEELDYYYQITD